MLDTGRTCSFTVFNVADNLGLDGPCESITLNGIQRVSELSTKGINLQVRPPTMWIELLMVDYLNIPERKVNLKELKLKATQYIDNLIISL